MYQKSFPILLGLLLISLLTLKAQEDIFAFNPISPDQSFQTVSIENQSDNANAVLGERMIHIPVQISILSRK